VLGTTRHFGKERHCDKEARKEFPSTVHASDISTGYSHLHIIGVKRGPCTIQNVQRQAGACLVGLVETPTTFGKGTSIDKEAEKYVSINCT
jgi:hypothetical protein